MVLFLLLLLQVPRSQHGSVTQRVGMTDIAISYNRPVARGRELFGSLVHWGRIWHPGADSATTISFSKNVIIDGHALAAGRYALDHSGSATQAVDCDLQSWRRWMAHE